MPPGDVPEATTGIDPTPPLSIEMPTAEEAGADETPVPVEMQDTGKEPEPAEKYGVDTLEEAAPPDHVPSAEESDWGFKRNKRALSQKPKHLRRRNPPRAIGRSSMN